VKLEYIAATKHILISSLLIKNGILINMEPWTFGTWDL
jgi:hypothetical protein